MKKIFLAASFIINSASLQLTDPNSLKDVLESHSAYVLNEHNKALFMGCSQESAKNYVSDKIEAEMKLAQIDLVYIGQFNSKAQEYFSCRKAIMIAGLEYALLSPEKKSKFIEEFEPQFQTCKKTIEDFFESMENLSNQKSA